MVQPQSESAAPGGGSIVPNLTNGDSIKKVMGRKTSYLNGLMSMNHVVGGIAKGGALSKLLASSSTTTTQTDTAISPTRSEHPVKMIEVAHSLKHNQEITREPSNSGNSAGSGSGRSISIMPGAPNMVSNAEPIVKLVSNNSESKNAAVAEKMTENCSAAEKSSTEKTAHPVIVKKSPLEILEIKLDYAFNDAQRHAEMFEQQRILRQAERDIADIESGRKRFTNPMQKDAILETAKAKKAAADQSLRDSGPPRYAQTLKKLHDVTRAIEAFCAAQTDSNKCSEAMQASVKRLEEVMAPIDNIWNGIPGKTPDLRRPGVAEAACVSSSERLKQIQNHLEAKINTVDGAQLQRISVVKENKAFKEILSLHDAGELPKDGSLIFFTSDGLLLYQSELKVSQRSTQSRAKDAASAQRHAANTPAFIDVVRLSQGLGPEGAGLWRFIGQENRIVGAAVLRPVFKDGKPVELPGAKNGRGEPMVKKEVTMTVGEIPSEVSLNMAYGHLLNTLRAKKTAMEKGIEPKSQETFAPDAVTGPVRIQAEAKADTAECAVSPKPQRISISVFAEGA